MAEVTPITRWSGQIMGGASGEPKGDLKAAIDRNFGGFDKLHRFGTRVAFGQHLFGK